MDSAVNVKERYVRQLCRKSKIVFFKKINHLLYDFLKTSFDKNKETMSNEMMMVINCVILVLSLGNIILLMEENNRVHNTEELFNNNDDVERVHPASFKKRE